MRGGRWLLQVTLEYLSWIGGFPPSWPLNRGNCKWRIPLAFSNMGFNKRSVISSVRLGPVTTLLGHSVMECGEETSVDDHRGTASGESPWVVLGRVICNRVSSLVDPISQSSSFGRVTCTGSRPPFRSPWVYHHPT